MKRINKLVILPAMMMLITACSPKQEAKLESISLSGTYQTRFELNETFNYEGLVVTAHYSNNFSKAVSTYEVSTPNMSQEGQQDVTVSYEEKNISKTASYIIYIGDSGLDPAVVSNALKELNETFNTLDIEEYSDARWQSIVDKLNEATNQIKVAVTNEQVRTIKTNAINFMNSVQKNSDITRGTWFGYKSAGSNYQYERDNDNNLVITYNGYPGHWKHVGTNFLETDVSKDNVFLLRFRNDISSEINYDVQLHGTGGYKVDSGLLHVAGGQTAEVRLAYDKNVTKFYFFLDSCEGTHSRQGHITILEARLLYEDRDITELPEPQTITVNQTMVKGDGGENTHIQLTSARLPLFIGRISALVEIDFHENSDGLKWFGMRLHAGALTQTFESADGYTQESKYPDSKEGPSSKEYYVANMPLTIGDRLMENSDLYMDVGWCADGIDFKLISYTLYYTLWKPVESETVSVNTVIWGDGKTDASIPFSSFEKKGRVDHIDVSFTTINTASYAKSQIYFGDNVIPFTNFSSGSNNVLNIAPIMEKSNPNEVTGTMTLYPCSDIDLSANKTISITCWWSSASMIKVDSITVYTDNVEAPEDVTGLEAHPINQGVVLTWAASNLATSYEVYNGNTLVDTVKSTFITIEGLTNGQTYTFKVVAKNSSGTSSGVTVQGTPDENATYDTFIEGLNTELEVFIGEEKMATLLSTSCQYISSANNARLQEKIAALRSGTSTTALFCGGSITVGENNTELDENGHQKGYAYWTKEWLKNNYDTHNKLKFVNASISGTGSEIGIVRAQKDILDHNPDIVFIEFAANNGSTDFYKQSYESLIRKVMGLPNDPAIVLVFSCTSYTGSSEKYMKDIGEHYSLPMFTFDKGFRAICDGALDKDRTDPTFRKFTEDATHPNQQGHILMSKALCYFLRNLLNDTTDTKNTYPSSPSKTNYDKYETFHSFDNTNGSSVITSLGSFVAADTATDSTSIQSDVTAFKQGWKKTDTTANEPMVINVNAKNFIIIYCAGNPSTSGDPTGMVEVTYTNVNDSTDNGTLTWDVSKTNKQDNSSDITQITETGNGWRNPCGILIFDKTTVANYTISIKMSDNSGICTIMAFGYSD